MNRTARNHFIIAGIFGIGFLVSLSNCNSSKPKKEVPKEGVEKYLGVFIKRDGTKQVDVLIRQTLKYIKYDSVKKIDEIAYETLWGFPVMVKAFDSTGKILKAKNGQDSINPQPRYIPIGKDSVTWYEKTPFDSLMKK